MTLEELLDKYFYKESVEKILSDFNEKTSGNKDEMIARLLQSKQVQKMNVTDFARHVLINLRKRDLLQLCKDLGLSNTKNSVTMVDLVLANVKFEPFIRADTRPCQVCGKETNQELHFGDNWKIAYFSCQTCLTESQPNQGLVSTSGNKPLPEEEFLHLLLEKTESQGIPEFNIFDIGIELGLDQDMIQVIAISLKNKGLVIVGLGGSILLTSKGRVHARGYIVDNPAATQSTTVIVKNAIVNSSMNNSTVTQTATSHNEDMKKDYKRMEFSATVFGIMLTLAGLFSVPIFGWLTGAIVAIVAAIVAVIVFLTLFPNVN